jgi:hypothetical protein
MGDTRSFRRRHFDTDISTPSFRRRHFDAVISTPPFRRRHFDAPHYNILHSCFSRCDARLNGRLALAWLVRPAQPLSPPVGCLRTASSAGSSRSDLTHYAHTRPPRQGDRSPQSPGTTLSAHPAGQRAQQPSFTRRLASVDRAASPGPFSLPHPARAHRYLVLAALVQRSEQEQSARSHTMRLDSSTENLEWFKIFRAR